MKTKTYFLLAICLLALNNKGQDIIFQPFANQNLLELNPSFAGNNGFLRYQAGVSVYAPNNFFRVINSYNNADVYIKKLHAGLALTYSNSFLNVPEINSHLLGLTYAQHLAFLDKKLKITPSLQFGYGHRHLDNYGVFFIEGDGFVPQWYSSKRYYTKDYFDLSGSLLINYGNLYIGSSLAHINNPDVAFYGLGHYSPRLRVHGSYNLKINEKNLIQFLVSGNSQYGFSYLQGSVNALLFKHLILGAGYISNENLFGNIGYRNNFISTSIGFNKTVSRLAGTSVSTVHFNFAWYIRNKEQRNVITSFETW